MTEPTGVIGYALLQIVQSDEATYTHILPRGKVYASPDVPERMKAECRDAGRVEHVVVRVEQTDLLADLLAEAAS